MHHLNEKYFRTQPAIYLSIFQILRQPRPHKSSVRFLNLPRFERLYIALGYETHIVRRDSLSEVTI